MVRSSLIGASMALASSVHGHYTFVRLAVNGKWLSPMQYVRNKTHGYVEPTTPYYNWNDRSWQWWTVPSDRPESMRCGRDNMAWANKTDVLTVRAGDQIEFAHLDEYLPYMWTDDMFNACPDGRGTCDVCPNEGYCYGRPRIQTPYFHEGAVVVHISKVPEGQDVHSYDGSGEWVKIHSLGLEYHKNETKKYIWLPRNRYSEWVENTNSGRIIFKLPKETPKGQYLLRAASIWHGTNSTYDGVSQINEGQLYHSCAQIQVDSDMTGSLPTGVLIPDIFKYDQPGMVISSQMANYEKIDEGYRYPGGPLWNGKELVEDKPSL